MIALTDSASMKVRQLMEQEGHQELALRVAVRPGGHSGIGYELFFDSDVAGDDVSAEFGGVKVVADPMSARMLEGATLDYEDSAETKGFSITNPNTGQGCGCGGHGQGQSDHGHGGHGCGCGGHGQGHGQGESSGHSCGCGGH